MTFREELIESIKGKPGSLTSQAFNTGVIVERERIIAIIERCPRIDDDYMIQCDARHLIALIKGDNK